MKHNIKHRKMNRTSSHRKALLMNLSNALIIHEQITTTLPKAKELRPFIEKIGKIEGIQNTETFVELQKTDKDPVYLIE